MQKLISAAYKMLASSVSPQSGCSPLAQAVQGDAVQRMQAAAQRLLVQANIGVLPDCNAFLAECHLSVMHAYRIEQEYKTKAPSKAAAKSIRLVRSCIRAWISAFKRFAKLMCLEHLKLKVHAVDRKGSYAVSVEEKEVTDAAGSVLAQYLECGEYLNVPSTATMQLYEEHRVCEEEPLQEAAGDAAMEEGAAAHDADVLDALITASDDALPPAVAAGENQAIEQGILPAMHRAMDEPAVEAVADDTAADLPADIVDAPVSTAPQAPVRDDFRSATPYPPVQAEAVVAKTDVCSAGSVVCDTPAPPKRRVRVKRQRAAPNQAFASRITPDGSVGSALMPSSDTFGLVDGAWRAPRPASQTPPA